MYRLLENGVMNLDTNQIIPNDPGNRHWAIYQEWLQAGNTPDPMLPEVVLTIDEEYDRLSDWMKIALGPAAAAKAAVAALRNQ
jgi:hypothetical protein